MWAKLFIPIAESACIVCRKLVVTNNVPPVAMHSDQLILLLVEIKKFECYNLNTRVGLIGLQFAPVWW